MPTYVAGDTVRVCVEVKLRSPRKGICRVYATFVHETDPTREIEISDAPESRSHAQVQTEDDVELKGLVVAGAHPPGEYRLKEMAAEFPGGRIVRFAETPDAAFRVVEEEIRSPEVAGWRWL
jgi:8-oxo-dGTP pyrophosphatase MutT (NUDIX family)